MTTGQARDRILTELRQHWRTIEELGAMTGFPPSLIPQILLQLRSKPYGRHVIASKKIKGRTWAYRLADPT